jgi:myo-inositol-1(or 4)-monophosphatase
MNRFELNARFEFGKKLIKEAGQVAQKYFRKRHNLDIKLKGSQDFVTEADVNIELLIRDKLKKAFPQDAFLGEETGLSQLNMGQGIWVVDPIDGTQPFISGLSSWCVSIGFVVDGDIKFGIVYAPERNEFFSGSIFQEALLNGKKMNIHQGKTVKDGIVGIGYSTRITPNEFLAFFTDFLQKGGMFSREGSGALSLCYVASGSLLGYIEPHINSWDCVGAVAIIQAAQLKTSDFLADDGLRKGNYLVAGNAHVFPSLIEILSKTKSFRS